MRYEQRVTRAHGYIKSALSTAESINVWDAITYKAKTREEQNEYYKKCLLRALRMADSLLTKKKVRR